MAPTNGIYTFYTQAGSYGANFARLYFLVNGQHKSWAYRNEDVEHDIVSIHSQFSVSLIRNSILISNSASKVLL